MEILYTLLIGLVVGAVAKLLMPGKDPGGCIITTIIGIAGAFIAKFIGQALNWYDETDPVGFIASVLGAILLLILYRVITGKRSKP
ncbi:MAG: GlsB/YeaQ/YmgE family stress response membrane protein [Verrucomicrobiaceae bacterium]|nr:GlsB/YeaQ/YmgE family stress response membrane protein [Verrucomicrobiaceae bacterium]